MVGLVVEPMRQRRRQLLLELLRRRDAAVFDGPDDACVVEPIDKTDDSPVLGRARSAKFLKCLEQDCVQPAGGVAASVNRCIQIRSVTKRWFNVPWTDPKKAPRSARYCSVESRATASYSRPLAQAL